MKSEYVPGATFPDFTLPDHTGTVRRLSELQGNDPMVLLLSRGRHCPREQQHHRAMTLFYEWCAVAFTQLVTISHNDLQELNAFRNGAGARWIFMSDTERVVQRTLDIPEYTDTFNKPMVPHTVVLAPKLVIEKIYVGYWFWGRPSPYDLWNDLREMSKRIRLDFDPNLPAARAAWEAAQAR